MLQTVPAESINHLITDGGADRDELTRLAEVGVQIRLAPVTAASAAS
jgi:hypothetical protein